jgi:hypothetical protein
MFDMRPGTLYLSERSCSDVNPSTANHVELDPVSCSVCGKRYRLFTPKDWKEHEDVTALGWDGEIKDLRERALQAVGKECPDHVPEGHRKRGTHPSPIRLLESDKYSI